MLYRHKSGRNKGFGFTTFSSEDALEAALQSEEYTVGGEVVKINRAGPRPEYEMQRDSDDLDTSSSGAEAKKLEALSRQPQLFGKGPRLYVGGVPESLTEERLKAHFSRWGNVVDLYFPGRCLPSLAILWLTIVAQGMWLKYHWCFQAKRGKAESTIVLSPLTIGELHNEHVTKAREVLTDW